MIVRVQHPERISIMKKSVFLKICIIAIVITVLVWLAFGFVYTLIFNEVTYPQALFSPLGIGVLVLFFLCAILGFRAGLRNRKGTKKTDASED